MAATARSRAARWFGSAREVRRVDGVEVPPPRTTAVVDEVGAGDAFAAGFVYGLLHGWDATDCARAGNVIAAGALAGTGDWETLPRLEDVRDDLAPARDGRAERAFRGD